MDLKESSPEFKEALAQYALRDFKFFVRAAWQHVQPARPLSFGFHVEAICDHLQALADLEIRNLLIEMPPRHGKSTICSVLWPAWMIARNPSWLQLHASYRSELSTRDVMKSRDLLKSDWFRSTFAPKWEIRPDQDRKTVFETTMKGGRRAVSAKMATTGLGGDNICGDDLTPAGKRILTPEILYNVIDWLIEQYYSRVENEKTATRLFVGQRTDVGDVQGFLRANHANRFEILTLPAEYDPARHCKTKIWEDPRTYEGEPLWSEGFGEDEIEGIKSLGEERWQTQYQQNPSVDNSRMFKPGLVKFWTETDLQEVSFIDPHGVPQKHPQKILPELEQMEIVIQSWDMSFAGEKHNDRVAGQVWGYKGGSMFLLDAVCDNMDFIKTRKAVIDMWKKWPQTSKICVEWAANGPAIISALEDSIPVDFKGVRVSVGKAARAQAVRSRLSSAYLPHPKARAWAEPLLKELYAFAPRCKNDDQVDALTQGISEIALLAAELEPETEYMTPYFV